MSAPDPNGASDTDKDAARTSASGDPANTEPAKQAEAAPDPLDPAISAMDRGDLVEAKRIARELSRDAKDPEIRTRADNLLSQLAPDPVVIAVLIATGLLAIVLYLVYRS